MYEKYHRSWYLMILSQRDLEDSQSKLDQIEEELVKTTISMKSDITGKGGFSDKMASLIAKKVDLEDMQNNPNTMEVREQLLTLSGVGPKVADCILLFSTLKRFEVFPIDVWVRRVMNELYIKNKDETKVNKKALEKLAQEKFGNLAGIAQQYLFYWKREA